MAESALPPLEVPAKKQPASVELHQLLVLQLTVTDPDSVEELSLRPDPRERVDYALAALRIGLLSLKHARGQIDAEAVKREGERLLEGLNLVLADYRKDLNESVSISLREYFDPKDGKFQERVDRLVRQDGEIEQVIRRQISADGSQLATTLAAHVGSQSPLMRLLDPAEAGGIVRSLRETVAEVLETERNTILAEFSLDKKESAINRLVSEITEGNGRLKADLADKVDAVFGEFSLDKEDSALSRLVRKVEAAQNTITKEFSLDNENSALSRMSGVLATATDAINNNLTLDKEDSALSRLKRELLEILNTHEQKATLFQTEVKTTLDSFKARREESMRSTSHGNDFQDKVSDFAKFETQRIGDIPVITGTSTGSIRNSKVGDVVVELGNDSTAAGAKYVIEAKEDASYDLSKARGEIETARKNREAGVGLFVFSKRTAPAGLDPLLRQGEDLFVIWDAEDPVTDVYLNAALILAKALCVRQAKLRTAEATEFEAIDGAVLEIERLAAKLEQIKTWTETIQNSSGKVLEEVRKMHTGLEQKISLIRDSLSGLKQTVPLPQL